jgi:hypothetical protein
MILRILYRKLITKNLINYGKILLIVLGALLLISILCHMLSKLSYSPANANFNVNGDIVRETVYGKVILSSLPSNNYNPPLNTKITLNKSTITINNTIYGTIIQDDVQHDSGVYALIWFIVCITTLTVFIILLVRNP